MIYVFTASAINYFPKFKISINSIKQHHPEFKSYLVVADTIPDRFNKYDIKADETITISDLNIPDWKSWAFGYSVIELCTAIKPFVLKYLFNKQDCEAVLFIDPDIVLFSRIDDLLEEFKNNSILLTPHQTMPETTLAAIIDNEVCSLRHGIYNLGFIGVKNDKEGQRFAKWWSERLYYFCLGDLKQGFWMDQKWIDFVPAFFDRVKILKSSRFNVAPWNITTRKAGGNFEQGFTIDGQPLGFYHFTGFDSGAHEIMANKYAGDNPAVKNLISWYKNNINDDQGISKTKWGFSTFSNNMPISAIHRYIYRSRIDLQKSFPDPFNVIKKGQCYYNWFSSRARIEYPEIVNSNQSEITQVFQIPHSNPTMLGERTIWKYFMKSLRNPHYGRELVRKATAILSKEGFKGLKRRLQRG